MRLEWIGQRDHWRLIGRLLIVAVIALSLLPAALLPGLPTPVGSDKCLHASAYFVLAAWYVPLWRSRRAGWVYAVGWIALGIALEVLQGFTASRISEWLDAVANTVGVLLGSSLAWTAWARLFAQRR